MKSNEGEELRSQMSDEARSIRSGQESRERHPRRKKAIQQSSWVGFKPSERRAADVRRTVPRSHQKQTEAVHAIREVFVTADADEDGRLNEADVELLAWQLWELLEYVPADPQAELQQIMRQYADKHGQMSLEQFSRLLSSTEWKQLLPETVQESLSTVPPRQPLPKMPVERSRQSPARQRDYYDCYGPPKVRELNRSALSFQEVRRGEIPEKIVRNGYTQDPGVIKSATRSMVEAMHHTVQEQQYPVGPKYKKPSTTEFKYATGKSKYQIQTQFGPVRTGVQFRPPPSSTVNAFGQRKPDRRKPDTYKTLINHAFSDNRGTDQDVPELVSSMDGFIKIAMEMFQTLDADKNGTIEKGELSLGLQHIWAELGVSSLLATPQRCYQEAAKIVEKFGSHIKFTTFLRVLMSEPWRNLLPSHVLEGAQFQVMRLANKKTESAPLKSALKRMNALFEDIDTDADGLLNYEQFEVLMHAIWEELDVNPPNIEHLHERAAQRVFGTIDCLTNSLVEKTQFMAIMCETPWVNYLPRNIRDDMQLEGWRRKAEALDVQPNPERQASPEPGHLSPENIYNKQRTGRGMRPAKWRHSRTVGELAAAQWKGPRRARPSVIVFMNDGGVKRRGTELLVYSFESLLHDATVAMGTPYAMTRVFTLNGVELFCVEDMVDNQKLVVSNFVDFKQRGGYASDAVARKRENTKKGARAQNQRSDSPYMPHMRCSPHTSSSFTGLPPTKNEEFMEALKNSPASVGDHMLDSILGKMRDFYLN